MLHDLLLTSLSHAQHTEMYLGNPREVEKIILMEYRDVPLFMHGKAILQHQAINVPTCNAIRDIESCD